jgi:sigma-B regulation protein RsbQ
LPPTPVGALRPDIALAVARVSFESDPRGVLPQLTVPTLILQMQHDIAVPQEVGEYMARRIPRSALTVPAARGHLPHISAPFAVHAAIRRYLQ